MGNNAKCIALKIEPKSNLNYLEVKVTMGDTKQSSKDDGIPKNDDNQSNSSKSIVLLIIIISVVIAIIIIVICLIIRKKSSSRTSSLINAIDVVETYNPMSLTDTQPQPPYQGQNMPFQPQPLNYNQPLSSIYQ